MSKDPAFLLYTQDFLTGIFFMTDEQVGRYTRLLCLQHQTGHLEEKHMLSICKTYDKDIFCKFIKDNDGLFYNKRLETEINKRNKYCESRRNNAKMKKTISSAYAKHSEDEDSKKGVQRETKPPENDFITPELFNEFWRIYPRKDGKGKALTKWNQICTRKNKKTLTWREIRIAIHHQVKSERWQNKEFIPLPATWLNESRWIDDPKEMKNFKTINNKPSFVKVDGVKYNLRSDGEYYHCVSGERLIE